MFSFLEAREILAKRNSTFVISRDAAKYMARPHISGHTCAGIQGRGHSCVIGHIVGSALHVRMSFRDINVHIQVSKTRGKGKIIDKKRNDTYAYEAN